MSKKKVVYAADFETTVFKGQSFTEVWAAACVELNSENVMLFSSIDQQFDFFATQPFDIVAYYHNLKFDGSFWLNWLLRNENYNPAFTYDDNKNVTGFISKSYDMPECSYKYLISNLGQWYGITIRTPDNIIELRDSVKILPFSLRKIAKDFETKHKKLDMQYTGERHANGNITEHERKYIENDVLVLAEALVKAFDFGLTKMTIGSSCLSQFRTMFNYKRYNYFFPDLRDYDGVNYDNIIRQSYHGGWCYVNPKHAEKMIFNGCTYDVNSLYPSVMHSESGNIYPFGYPIAHTFGAMPTVQKNQYAFIHFSCRFDIKPNKLPFVQIKNKFCYNPNEHLTTSDIIVNGKKSRYYLDEDGNKHDTICDLTMTQTDFKLFLDHYNISDFKLIECVVFRARKGLFDDYINKWRDVKINAQNLTERSCAKLLLNNLYGKLASSDDSSFKIAYLREGHLSFYTIVANEKQLGYIPIGTCITSYARNFTIRAAQANYEHFIYADTDSIHLNCKPEQAKNLVIHDTNFNSWKMESIWKSGYFLRQKSYVEKIQKAQGYEYNVKCAGMPKECQKKFAYDLKMTDILGHSHKWIKTTGKRHKIKTIKGYYTPKVLTDFTIGLTIPNALKERQIVGGVVLVSSDWIMRPQINVKNYFK